MKIVTGAVPRRDFLASAVKTAAAMTLWPREAGALPDQLQPRGPVKKVIVIGAGLAGLSAGFELTQAGHDVTILEAQMRAGGRACSIRQPFSDGLYAEAGATGIAETNDLTLKYARLFGLELDSWDPPPELQDILYIRGPLQAFLWGGIVLCIHRWRCLSLCVAANRKKDQVERNTYPQEVARCSPP